jgi:N-acetylneuraminic acid mutarotase
MAGAAVAAVAAVAAGRVPAQDANRLMPPRLPRAASSAEPFATLRDGKLIESLTPEQLAQHVVDSPAPAGPPGRWLARAMLPVPRSEMAWATAWSGRMHVIGGYGEGRLDRAYHHVYDPALDRWFDAAPLPRGANHVAVAAAAGRIYAMGGFVEQNRKADGNAYAYEVSSNRWRSIAPLTRPRGAAAAVAFNGRIHLIGGAGDPPNERASVGWHEVYDPTTDKWSVLKPLPGARDRAGAVVFGGAIHLIGGRFNAFEYNTGLHHAYIVARNTWEVRAPMPTPRAGLGLASYRNRLFAMGGEGRVIAEGRIGQARVFGQMESYDPRSDSWQRHTPMPTPRHGVGAVAIGDWIYVAGGGAVTGGAIQSAVTEAFSLGSDRVVAP